MKHYHPFIICLIFWIVLISEASASFSELSDLEHMFNAHTFSKKEAQFYLIGPSKYGLFDGIEVGSFLLFDLASLYNFLLKLRVYNDPQFSIAFEYLLLYIGIDNYEIEGENQQVAFKQLMSPLLFNSTYSLSPSIGLNGGLFDLMFLIDIKDDSGSFQSDFSHTLGVHTGFDWIPAARHAISLTVGAPLYISDSFKSDFIEADISGFNRTPLQNLILYLCYQYSGYIYSGKSFNLEIGSFYFISAGSPLPYLAFGWRY